MTISSSVQSIWVNQEGESNPFLINGNEELENFVITNNLSGSGSEQDPYIIEDFEIMIPNSEKVIGFEIKNTDKYVIIRNNSFLSTNSDEFLGISITGSKNLIIEDNTFRNFKIFGIEVSNAQEISIRENQISNVNSDYDFPDEGIIILDSTNISVINNNIISQGTGIRIVGSNNTLITENVIHARFEGINLQGSFYSNVTSNEFTLSGITVYDVQPGIYMTLEFENNKINNKPIEIVKNSSILPTSIELGQLLLFGVENILIRDLIFKQLTPAILIVNSKNIEFTNLEISSSTSFGLSIEHSYNVSVHNSTFTNIENIGVSIRYSNETSINFNDFTNNTRSITSYYSSYNIVRENYFSDGLVGIVFDKSGPAKIDGNTFDDVVTPIKIDRIDIIEVGANYYIEDGKTVTQYGIYQPKTETNSDSVNFFFNFAIFILPIMIYKRRVSI